MAEEEEKCAPGKHLKASPSHSEGAWCVNQGCSLTDGSFHQLSHFADTEDAKPYLVDGRSVANVVEQRDQAYTMVAALLGCLEAVQASPSGNPAYYAIINEAKKMVR